MKIICVAGQKRNGKDEIANYLAEKLNLKRMSFAYNVKNIFCKTFGVDFDFVEKWKNIPEPPPGFDMCVRDALMFIGDGFRKIKRDIWIDLVFRDDPVDIAISDGRYINELEKVKQKGGINILIYRPDFRNDVDNDSESQVLKLIDIFIKLEKEGKVEDRLIDYFIINNGNLDDLRSKINNLILQEKS
jgi:hypothetical protein